MASEYEGFKEFHFVVIARTETEATQTLGAGAVATVEQQRLRKDWRD